MKKESKDSFKNLFLGLSKIIVLQEIYCYNRTVNYSPMKRRYIC